MRAPPELGAIALLLLVAVPHAALAKTESAVAYVLSLYDPDALGGTARYTPRTQHLWDECLPHRQEERRRLHGLFHDRHG